MARKKSTVVISNWKGITTVRSKPVRVKQTSPTKQAGELFGMAANRSALIRKLLLPILPEPNNRVVINRFQQAFYQWLRAGALDEIESINHIPFFEGLSFNEKNDLSQFLSFSFTAERLPGGETTLNIPAFDPALQIKWPDGIFALEMVIAATCIQLEKPEKQTYWQTVIPIQKLPGLLEPQQIILPLVAGTGKLLIVTVALKYIATANGQQMVKQLPWKPAGIVATYYN